MAKHETTVQLNAKDNTGRAFDSAERGMKSLDDAGSLLIGTIGKIGPAILGAFSFGAALSFASETARQARELQGLSASADLAVNELLAYGKATRTAGIGVDKFADIVKDVNDKLGEFAATGGGGFKDFFDVVPKSIAPTVASLSKLSGPDVLIAVKKAMDEANISGKEQIFVLESIGNDASRLIPLLENSGEKFNDIADGARNANNQLNALQRDNILKAAEAFDEAGAKATGFFQKVTAAGAGFGRIMAKSAESIVGVFSDLLFDEPREVLEDLQNEAADLREMLETKIATGGAAFALRDLAGELEEVNREIALLQKGLGDTDKLMAFDDAADDAKDLADNVGDAVKQAENFARVFENISDSQKEITSNLEKIQDIQSDREPVREATVLGALSKGQGARFALDRGNVELASKLALEAAQELRQVEEDTGKKVLQAEGFIKNFEGIAKRALEKSEKIQEALILEIVVDGEKRQFKATKEGVKKANDFTKKQLKEAEKKRA